MDTLPYVTALDFTQLTCCRSLWLSRAGRVNQRTVRSTSAAGQIRCLPGDLEPSDEISVQGGCDVQGQTDLDGEESFIHHSWFKMPKTYLDTYATLQNASWLGILMQKRWDFKLVFQKIYDICMFNVLWLLLLIVLTLIITNKDRNILLLWINNINHHFYFINHVLNS